MRSLATLLLFACFVSPNAAVAQSVYWEGYYGGKYYPGRYYSESRLCCNKPNCGMRKAILASIYQERSKQQVVVASQKAPTTALLGLTVQYRTETRYRQETRTRQVQRCNGRRCWIETQTYQVRVPYQVQVPLAAPLPSPPAAQETTRDALRDTRLDPSSSSAVAAMLDIVQPTKGEHLVDLGCGDGRIVLAAAEVYGVTATGIELNPESAKAAGQRVRMAGLAEQVTIITGDVLTTEFDGDIVTMYLYPELIKAVWPKIKPGTIVISLEHDLPQASRKVDRGEHSFFVCVKRSD